MLNDVLLTCYFFAIYREAVEHFLIALNLQCNADTPQGMTSLMSEGIWSTLRLAMIYHERHDLLPLVDDKNLEPLLKEFGLWLLYFFFIYHNLTLQNIQPHLVILLIQKNKNVCTIGTVGQCPFCSSFHDIFINDVIMWWCKTVHGFSTIMIFNAFIEGGGGCLLTLKPV